MSYQQIVKLALKGRTVAQVAKEWEMTQMTLGRYAKGTRLPDYLTAKKMAEEAGISNEEMFNALVAEEAKRKGQSEKISKSFNFLLRAANAVWTRVPATA